MSPGSGGVGGRFSDALKRKGGDHGHELALAFDEHQLGLAQRLNDLKSDLKDTIHQEGAAGRQSRFMSSVTLAIVLAIAGGGVVLFRDIGSLETNVDNATARLSELESRVDGIGEQLDEVLATVRTIDDRTRDMADQASLEPGAGPTQDIENTLDRPPIAGNLSGGEAAVPYASSQPTNQRDSENAPSSSEHQWINSLAQALAAMREDSGDPFVAMASRYAFSPTQRSRSIAAALSRAGFNAVPMADAVAARTDSFQRQIDPLQHVLREAVGDDKLLVPTEVGTAFGESVLVRSDLMVASDTSLSSEELELIGAELSSALERLAARPVDKEAIESLDDREVRTLLSNGVIVRN